MLGASFAAAVCSPDVGEYDDDEGASDAATDGNKDVLHVLSVLETNTQIFNFTSITDLHMKLKRGRRGSRNLQTLSTLLNQQPISATNAAETVMPEWG